MSRTGLTTALLLLLIPVPLFLPYLWLSHFVYWSSPDSIFYLNLYKSYRNALWGGEWFPRWIWNASGGIGNMVFYIRSPLAFSLTALVNAPFRFSDETQYMVGMYASQCFGAAGMWWWLRGRYSHRHVMIGALLFTLLPYKLFMIYVHYNLAQCWAMAFLPLWLGAAERITTRHGLIGFGLWGGLCAHAHLLTFLPLLPLACVYALWRHGWDIRRVLLPGILAGLLTVGLTASYLASMVTAMPWMPLQNWFAGKYNTLDNLHHADSYFCAYLPLIACLYFGCRATLQQPVSYFWFAALLLLYAFATPLAYPIWSAFRALDMFQFPFDRFQPGMQMAAVMLSLAILSTGVRINRIRLMVVIVLFSAWIGLRVQTLYSFRADNHITPSVQGIALNNNFFMTQTEGEYVLPRWTSLTQRVLMDEYKTFTRLPRLAVTSGRATVKLIKESNGRVHFLTDVATPEATIRYLQLYVPAWQAHTQNKAISPAPSMPDGFVEFTLPFGAHEVSAALTPSALEEAGSALSWLALMVCIMHYLHWSIQQRRSL